MLLYFCLLKQQKTLPSPFCEAKHNSAETDNNKFTKGKLQGNLIHEHQCKNLQQTLTN